MNPIKMKGDKKGFTIIELIVVIAIIAVLAAIVLVNVTQYINKGKDASIQGNLAGVMINAAQYYDSDATNKGSYTSLCSNPVVAAAMTAIDGTRGDTGKSKCNASATEYAACGQLKSDSTHAYCVDSTGAKKTITNTVCVTAWAATVCP
ncbi:MAG: prepilin-type N-terminal cleavage/methylation domain-containing protein [Candidatus Staskawiczbacteria bacterium]|nr:prepilin-type N-terminal cleavage/methylation domain-containing protein [Candidatus Staskawiczbacteria bacterium]